MATSPSNRRVSQAPQSLRKVRFASLRKELLRLENGRLFAGVSVATVRRVLAIARAVKPEIPRGQAITEGSDFAVGRQPDAKRRAALSRFGTRPDEVRK